MSSAEMNSVEGGGGSQSVGQGDDETPFIAAELVMASPSLNSNKFAFTFSAVDHNLCFSADNLLR